MHFDYQLRSSWPPGAWLASGSEDDAQKATVEFGYGVEVFQNWFGEIVWDGEFDQAGFDATDVVFGSGGKQAGGSVLFVGASHTMDRLQTLESAGRWWVSNSLVCLMEATGAEIDPLCREYARRFASIISGLDRCHRRVPTSVGDVELVYCDNVRLQDGRLRREPKPTISRDVSTYFKYREFLESTLRRCAKNMRSPSRQRPYEYLGTISTGFDSPACAALADSAGLKDVVTFATARDDLCDDGSAIASRMNMKAEAISRDAWAELPLPEPPFLSSDAKGEDVFFAGLGSRLERRVLLTGYAAGAWSAACRANPELKRVDQSGLSLTEFRLWSDFIHLPVPTIGVRSASEDDVQHRSHDLQSWASGKRYDKPFCRRLLVESGVPAEEFGQQKKAASVLVFDRRSLLSPGSLADFREHLRQARGSRPLAAICHRSRDTAEVAASRAIWLGLAAARAIARVVPLRWLRRIAESSRLAEAAHYEPLSRYLFPWALAHARRRYRESADRREEVEQ
ncbi:MAG: hypothetical protein AAGJ46_17525 [Planctomycetota bacterium]